MNTQMIFRINEELKNEIKESSNSHALSSSEFFRMLYVCYKYGNGDKTSIYKLMDENLKGYKRHVENQYKESIKK